MADIGLRGELSASRDNTDGSGESANLGLSAYSSDFLSFTGVTSGVLALNFFLTGTLAGQGDNDNDFVSFMYNLSENTGPYGVVAAGNLITGEAPQGSKSSSASAGSTLNFNSGFVEQIAGVGVCITVNGGKVDGCPVRYDATGTVLLPFSSSGFSLNTSLQTAGRCVFAYAGCDFTADFNDTALLGGAVIYDANGNVVQGATIVSQSGYDYTQPIPVSAVPEPATFGMTAIALAALAIRLRKPFAACS